MTAGSSSPPAMSSALKGYGTWTSTKLMCIARNNKSKRVFLILHKKRMNDGKKYHTRKPWVTVESQVWPLGLTSKKPHLCSLVLRMSTGCVIRLFKCESYHETQLTYSHSVLNMLGIHQILWCLSRCVTRTCKSNAWLQQFINLPPRDCDNQSQGHQSLRDRNP